MKNNHLRDQRGVAMLFELVLVAAVLALAGMAVYQANNRSKTASVDTAKTAVTAEGLAADAAAVTELDAASDVALSAADESAADELAASAQDVSNLGGSSNDAF